MEMITLSLKSVSRSFNNRILFKDISFDVNTGSAIAVTGANGSGKSTLMKIIAGLLSPSKGEIMLASKDMVIPLESFFLHTGFCSPYMSLYDELSGRENLEFFMKLNSASGKCDSVTDVSTLLEKFGLIKASGRQVRYYSSGMKQRLKLAFAVMSKPKLLILDEPSTNLDEEGKSIIKSIYEEQLQRGILIIAANDEDDISGITNRINLSLNA